MKNTSTIIVASLILLASFSQAEDNLEIETKYLMFRLPKVRFHEILQLKRPGGKIDFGNGTTLTHDDIEPIAPGQPKNFTYRITLKKNLRFSNVVIHPKCVLDFVEFKERKLDKYLLDSIDCRSSSVEINRVKLRAHFHPTFAKDEFHFASDKVIAITNVPLENGKQIPPNKVIWIEDFDSDLATNIVKGTSEYYSEPNTTN
jgi:hypothetical protein